MPKLEERTPSDMLLQLEDIADHCLNPSDRSFVQGLIEQMHCGQVTALTQHQRDTLACIHRQHFA
ncbi:MAG TPA: hypothetical protein VLC92_01300 [Rhodocyclaceae bacterium]|nr:hypothetical protein [Rhodocyclaceae bacterium]